MSSFKSNYSENKRPLTNEEHEELKKNKEIKTEKLKKEGIYFREFFNHKINTNPDYLKRILERFLILNRSDPYWEIVSLKERIFDPITSYDLVHDHYKDFGLLGKIDLNLLNKEQLEMTITNYDGLIPFLEEEIAKEIYFKTVEKLNELSDYFSDLFGINSQDTLQFDHANIHAKNESFVLTPEKLKVNPAGRKNNQDYDAAFQLVLKGKSINEAYDFWKRKFPKVYDGKKLYYPNNENHHNETLIFTAFKEAMRYRLKKLGITRE